MNEAQAGRASLAPRLSEVDITRYKLINDLLTQVITLSTGAIVLVTTFLEQFAKHEHVGWLAIVALVAFGLSIGEALVSKWRITTLVREASLPPGSSSPARIAANAFLWTSLLFGLALACLVVFGAVNLWFPPS